MRNDQASFGEAFFEHRDSVVAPERLAVENEQRHAEDVVGCGFVLGTLIGEGAFTRQIFAIVAG
jgi:hypothetical protein